MRCSSADPTVGRGAGGARSGPVAGRALGRRVLLVALAVVAVLTGSAAGSRWATWTTAAQFGSTATVTISVTVPPPQPSDGPEGTGPEGTGPDATQVGGEDAPGVPAPRSGAP